TITLLEVTDTALIVDTVILCAGDSVEFFGEWLSVSGIYDHFEPIGNCVQHNQLVLQVLPPFDLDLEITQPTCFGFSDGSLTVQGGQGNLQFSLDGANWQADNVFDSLGAGSYEVFVQDENGCALQAEFTVNDPPQVFVQLPPDVTIEWGDTLTLQPTVLQDNLQFSWSPPDWLSCTDCQNPLAQPQDTILYVLTVADPNDCPASDSIQINVELTKAVYVPNVFTPNGDGINDGFYLFADGVAEVLLLRIFDRWGELVFEGANFPPNDERFSWDGVFRGKPMNSQVFAWYAIVGYVDGTTELLKGDLTLLR
ncbi:MAG: T9SS type B sorting domain-containing protein, partial [Bacteroidota bacterium]